MRETRGLFGFLFGLLPVFAFLVVVIVVFYEPPPSCGKAVVCAHVTFSCEGEKRVTMELAIINDTEVPQDTTFYEKTTASDGKFGEEVTPVHLEPGEIKSTQRRVKADITDEITIKLGEVVLATDMLGPADPCKWNDSRN